MPFRILRRTGGEEKEVSKSRLRRALGRKSNQVEKKSTKKESIIDEGGRGGLRREREDDIVGRDQNNHGMDS